LSELAKYSMKRSVARSLCDSWAYCLWCHLEHWCWLFVLFVMQQSEVW